MHDGRCTKIQLQAWALNRYFYQAMIPIKDATILSRIEDPALRRAWRQRIIDHDGEREADGGIHRWIKLAEGLGLDRDLVVGARAILPITRYAVEAYVHFCATKPLLEAIASSLTELFSPDIIGERVSGMLANYDFVTRDTLAYFTARPPQAQRDADFAIEWVKAQRTHRRAAAGRAAGAGIQMRRAVGAERRADARLCRRPSSSRRLAGRGGMSAARGHSGRSAAAAAARRAAASRRGARRPCPARARAGRPRRSGRRRRARSLRRRAHVERDRRRTLRDVSTASARGSKATSRAPRRSRGQKDGRAVNALHEPSLEPPLGLLAELTHVCPLGCPYCSNPLALDPRAERARQADWRRVFSRGRARSACCTCISPAASPRRGATLSRSSPIAQSCRSIPTSSPRASA